MLSRERVRCAGPWSQVRAGVGARRDLAAACARRRWRAYERRAMASGWCAGGSWNHALSAKSWPPSNVFASDDACDRRARRRHDAPLPRAAPRRACARPGRRGPAAGALGRAAHARVLLDHRVPWLAGPAVRPHRRHRQQHHSGAPATPATPTARAAPAAPAAHTHGRHACRARTRHGGSLKVSAPCTTHRPAGAVCRLQAVRHALVWH